MSLITTASGSTPVARFFDGVSRVYDIPALQRLVYRPAQDMVIEELRGTAALRVLDVGCGTGIFSKRLNDELGVEVIGCDLSPGMLDQARRKADGVGWVLGDSAQLPLGPESVDAVVCTEAFHFFDQARALGEFRRVLVPGGLIAIAMVNPRTGVGSRALSGQLPGRWPTQRDMRRMFAVEGFEDMRQRRVNRVLGRVIPTVLSVATRRP